MSDPIEAAFPVEAAFVKPSRLATAIDRSRATVYARIQSGEIKARRVDGVLRIPRDEAIRWLRSVTEATQ